uniref:ethanolamine kinase n=1 Tax=Steinernema glaseri TaxID=37863 RepID=A0A1I7ZBC9_9BILA
MSEREKWAKNKRANAERKQGSDMTNKRLKLERIDIVLPIHDDRELRLNALEILRTIKPQWHPETITFKDFTVGITNRIFAAFAEEQAQKSGDPTLKVIFRVFGHNTEKIIDREKELRNWMLLSDAKLAAPLLATFNNGIVCGYLEGESLDVDSVRNPKIVRKICVAIARMHKIHESEECETVYSLRSNKFLENIPDKFDDPVKQSRFEEYFSSLHLREEFDSLLERIKAQNNAIVFCHNDLLVYNILYDAATDHLHFIDYEYAGANYQLFDIANHFNEYAGVDDTDYSKLPSVEEKRDFLTTYLQELEGRDVNSDEVDELLKILPLFESASHHFWALWSLVQAHNSTIDFDYIGYAILRHKMSRKTLEEASATDK